MFKNRLTGVEVGKTDTVVEWLRYHQHQLATGPTLNSKLLKIYLKTLFTVVALEVNINNFENVKREAACRICLEEFFFYGSHHLWHNHKDLNATLYF